MVLLVSCPDPTPHEGVGSGHETRGQGIPEQNPNIKGASPKLGGWGTYTTVVTQSAVK